jgi:hypothetical protein
MFRFVSLRRIAFALAALAVLGLAGPAAAGEQVPFKGSLEGVDTATPLTPPFFSATVEATGEATHLGEFTLTILVTGNRATGMATGTFLFTAANGDTVFGTLSGQSTLTAPGVITIAENMIITGGTCRFADSTGSFTGTRLKNLATGETIGGFEGTISSPGAGNP